MTSDKNKNIGFVQSALRGMKAGKAGYPEFKHGANGCYDCIKWLAGQIEMAGQCPDDGWSDWTELVRDEFTPEWKQVDKMLADMAARQAWRYE